MGTEIIVQGLVQGVGYRFFVILKAKEYGLKGYVKNLANGNVLVVAEGNKGILNDFIRELKIGPSAANVTGIDVKWFEEDQEFENFSVKF